nr:MAG TPA: hypothetical protein [Caudoviricetes sp.]
MDISKIALALFAIKIKLHFSTLKAKSAAL